MTSLKTITLTGALLLASQSSNAADLQVIIAGIEGDTGEVQVNLFKGREGHLKMGHPDTISKRVAVTGATNNAVQVIFRDLEPGEYTFGAYHDADMNGTVNLGFLWQPTEGWAMSNNVVPGFGPPDYKKSMVKVTEDGTRSGTVLSYPGGSKKKGS